MGERKDQAADISRTGAAAISVGLSEKELGLLHDAAKKLAEMENLLSEVNAGIRMDIPGGRVEELTKLYDKSYKKFDKLLSSASVGQRATADQIRNIEYALGPHSPQAFGGPPQGLRMRKRGLHIPGYPDIPKSGVKNLLRGALKFALPAEVAYEGYRLSGEAKEHGLATGVKKHAGTMVKEVGGMGEFLGAVPVLGPLPSWGVGKIGGALSSAGDWIRGDEAPEEPLQISAERFETLMDSDSPQPSVKKKSNRWPYDR